MTQTRFPILVRLNKFGVIDKIVAPDLFLDLTSSIRFYHDLFILLNEEPNAFNLVREYLANELGEIAPFLREVRTIVSELEIELQDYIRFHKLKNLIPLHESNRVVKQNGRGSQWEEMTALVPKSRIQLHQIMTPAIISAYVFSTILDAYLGFYTNAVNSVPLIMAAITVATDILTATPDFFASGIEENSDSFFTCNAKQIETGYQLSDDFEIEEPIASKKAYWVLGFLFFAAQCISSGSQLVSEYVNYMYQYDLAYSENYVPSGFPYKFYMGLAITGFVLDNSFDLLMPLSTMITVGPKIGKLLEKVLAKCRANCTCCHQKTNSPEPDDNKVDVIIHRSYEQNGLFGTKTNARYKEKLLPKSENCQPEEDRKQDAKSILQQPPAPESSSWFKTPSLSTCTIL